MKILPQILRLYKLGQHRLSTSFFSKNQIILTEAHSSYFFCGFQAHLVLLCPCSSEVHTGKLEDNVSDRLSHAPIVDKKNSGVNAKMIVLKVKSCIRTTDLENMTFASMTKHQTM